MTKRVTWQHIGAQVQNPFLEVAGRRMTIVEALYGSEIHELDKRYFAAASPNKPTNM